MSAAIFSVAVTIRARAGECEELGEHSDSLPAGDLGCLPDPRRPSYLVRERPTLVDFKFKLLSVPPSGPARKQIADSRLIRGRLAASASFPGSLGACPLYITSIRILAGRKRMSFEFSRHKPANIFSKLLRQAFGGFFGVGWRLSLPMHTYLHLFFAVLPTHYIYTYYTSFNIIYKYPDPTALWTTCLYTRYAHIFYQLSCY